VVNSSKVYQYYRGLHRISLCCLPAGQRSVPSRPHLAAGPAAGTIENRLYTALQIIFTHIKPDLDFVILKSYSYTLRLGTRFTVLVLVLTNNFLTDNSKMRKYTLTYFIHSESKNYTILFSQ